MADKNVDKIRQAAHGLFFFLNNIGSCYFTNHSYDTTFFRNHTFPHHFYNNSAKQNAAR